MLQLKNIVKNYVMGDTTVQALKGVDLEFRKSDFVSILGPSGCGKTTLLNIIGGLDRYTSGDLVINGISTKEYKDVDWDIYRNNSIGFVFQTYNLISHQTVYSNVELALTLAGTSRAERHNRVVEVLEKVGLGDQINKKPTQMSGGQMQRVAIARALVNNPDILLADEPTGALDSGTSIQIMELLKEIAKDRLVIMVTHNPDLAQRYSTRTIKLLDGKVVDDSNPYASEDVVKKRDKKKRKKISMSFFTALALSFKNLLTKKTRTILTAFAGSIGIIGIALILSLSSGMQSYVKNLERDTLSTYPLELQSHTMDMAGMFSIMMGGDRSVTDNDLDKVYPNNIMTDMIDSMVARVKKNDLQKFKNYIETEGKRMKDITNTIQYRYNVDLQVFKPLDNDVLKVNPTPLFAQLGMANESSYGNGMQMNMGGNPELWTEMLGNDELLRSQYDLIAGDWPKAYNEIVLVLDENNQISDFELYALGLLDLDEFDELVRNAMKGEGYQTSNAEASFSYDEILSLTYKLILNTDYYVKEGNEWVDKREDKTYMKDKVENGIDLKIAGILRPSDDSVATAINSSVAYTAELTDYVIAEILKTDIAKEQKANPEINVFTGIPFEVNNFVDTLTMDDVMAFIAELPEVEQAQMQAMLESMPEEDIIQLFTEQIMADDKNKATYDDNIYTLGIADVDNPSTIRLYPIDFESKKQIKKLIKEYNDKQLDAGNEEQVIEYTDYIELMTSSISSIIDIISYVLIAFVAISLVVSSIMIAIITYISVLERTKEIGILRSIGASKKDITRVFNAETFIEGFVAGTMGILITLLLNIPINAVIKSLTDISGMSKLPLYGAIGLIIISIVLTLIAGFIPSKMAAKKDPVVALRTE